MIHPFNKNVYVQDVGERYLKAWLSARIAVDRDRAVRFHIGQKPQL
jgi:hypothetical protein